MNSEKTHPCLAFPYKDQLRFKLVTATSSLFWKLMDYASYHVLGLAFFYEKIILEEYTKEYELLPLSKKPLVMHVGCGSYPLTSISLATAAPSTHIVGIDKNHTSATHAKNVIDEKHLSQRITIEEADGSTYDVSSFDIIIISSCSWPKVYILDHLFTKAKPGCLFIIRELELAIDPIKKCINRHKEITLLKQFSHHPFPFVYPFGWQTFFAKKKSSSRHGSTTS